MRPKSGLITFVLSFFVPGLGHLYLGLNNRGLQFMIAFFAFIIMIPAMPMVFPFAIAILWFYSLFDALQKAALINAGKHDGLPELIRNEEHPAVFSDLDKTINPVNALRERNIDPLWIGVLCIAVGILLLVRQVFPRLWEVLLQMHIGSILLALILIGFGVRLLIVQNKKE